jgi:hypothetical protein
VGNPGAGAHDLYVAGFSAALVAKVVLVGNGPFTDIGDDFHVAVRVLRETGAGAITSSFQTRRLPQFMRLGSWYSANEKW